MEAKKKLPPALTDCPLFAGMTADETRRMLGCFGGVRRRYDDGQTILAEGGAAHRIGVVLSGQVRITRTDYGGSRSVIAAAGPGELFGEAFAFAGAERLPVDVCAVGTAEVLLLPAEKLAHPCGNACEFHSRLILNLLRILASKNLLMNRKLQILARRTTREKLLAYLRLQAAQEGSASFEIPFDRQALADYLEVDRSGLSAQIGALRREEVLRCEKNRFTLLRPEEG